MSERIPQSITKRVVFRAYLASDGKTPATGKTIAITISKNGGAFGNPAAGATNATAISSGFYYFDLGTGDTGTQGPLAWRGAEGTIDDAGDVYEVVNATNAGFTALPNAAADAAGGLPISDAGGLDLDAKLANTHEVTAARMGALTDWIDGGRLDLILDARASQTSIDTVDGIVDSILLDTGTDGVVVAAGSKTGYSLATGGAGSGAIAAAELNNIADAVLDRNMATGTDSGSTTVRTPRQALRLLRNARSIAAGTLSVKKEDDSTNSWTAAVTTTAGDPIDSVDPAGP